MSLFAKVRCDNCGGNFEIYHKQFVNQAPVAACPHCNTKMTEKQWKNLINCYHTTLDWNAQCIKSHEDHGAPLFSVELHRHFVRRNKFRREG